VHAALIQLTVYSCGQLKCNETLSNSKKVLDLCDTESLFNIMCSAPESDAVIQSNGTQVWWKNGKRH